MSDRTDTFIELWDANIFVFFSVCCFFHEEIIRILVLTVSSKMLPCELIICYHLVSIWLELAVMIRYAPPNIWLNLITSRVQMNFHIVWRLIRKSTNQRALHLWSNNKKKRVKILSLALLLADHEFILTWPLSVRS
jgi:hypothetical protein